MMQRFVSIAQMLVLLCSLVAAPAWPSTVTVTSNADSGANTLRAAIAGANAGDTIAFALQGGTTITLASTLTLAKDVTIDGIGSGGLVISGNHAVEVFWVNAGVTATITNLTIADGTSADSGGIRNQGTLTVANCTLRGNSSPSGAAIINQAILTLTNSTLSGNSASFVGGGLWQASSGTATIVNNTFAGNSAVLGGAIYSQSASASTITNNLFFGNDASSSGGSIADAAHAIGADHNLYWNNSDSSGPQGTNCGNCVSNTNAVNADPVLGILKYNGGATWTYLPGAGSAAIDAGASGACPLTDQRGIARPQPVAGACDIGSVEARTVSVWTVNTVADTNDGVCDGANCTLREAISAAQAGDTIAFSSLFAAPQTINLGSALPTITVDLTITGPGANLLAVRANASGFPVVRIDSGLAAISGLTIANGNADSGGGIDNHGNLLLTDSVVSGNHASVTGGGIRNAGGLFVLRSTLVGNDAPTGAALYNFASSGAAGLAVLFNTTFSGNSATTRGNAIANANLGGAEPTVKLVNCTIADQYGGAPETVASVDAGGSASISLENTLFTRNSGASLAIVGAAAQIASLGHNLASDTGGGFLTGTGDLISTDPLLAAALGNYGGHTPTYLMALNSPAVNAGDFSGAPFDDQRGVPRSSVDIGAVELRPLLITSAADPGDGTCDSSCTLRDAITAANAGDAAAHDLFFDATFNTPQTINLTAALPSIAKGMTFNGPGANLLTVRRDTGGDYRIFTVNPGFATISGMTIANGKNGFGGGISNAGWLTVDRCTLTGNQGTTNGGAMQNTGVLVMTNSTISGNTAGYGGGLFNYSLSGSVCPGCSATLTNTTISGNTATGYGGGIINRNYGGVDPTVTLINSTVAGNTEPGVLAYGQGTIYLQNTIATNNQTQDLADFGTNPHVISLGHNITGGDGGGYLTMPGDLINTNPLLATLGNYGGTTPTMYLKPGSPAINAGDDTAAPDIDQRGVLRPVGAHVDIGAVEADGTLIFQDGFDGL